MTYDELVNLIEENNGEIQFSNGAVLTDWRCGQFCYYTAEQQFGEGTVIDFYEALEFYNNNNK